MLTRKQHELLMFIHNHLKSTGFSPSFDEMKDGLDLKSKSGVHRLITALEERGFLKRRAHRARALEVVRLPSDDFQSRGRNAHENSQGINKNLEVREDFSSKSQFVRLPMVGRIAAGNPIEAIGESESYLDVPSNLITLGEHYAVKVSGDSMVEAGILDGDIAIIQVGTSFDNGEVVVALIDDFEVTLKKIRKKGNSIALEPCNSMYETRIFGSNRIKVQGRLAGLMRIYSKYN